MARVWGGANWGSLPPEDSEAYPSLALVESATRSYAIRSEIEWQSSFSVQAVAGALMLPKGSFGGRMGAYEKRTFEVTRQR